MVNSPKNLAFEFLLFKLDEWQKSETKNDQNDLSILKSLKLLFFVSAVSADKNSEDTLLDDLFDNFVAMPYGHVESEIYTSMGNKEFQNVSIDNRKTIFNHLDVIKSLDLSVQNRIVRAIEKLRSINPNLIILPSFDLVDLSHNWWSWQHHYNLALKQGMNSKIIPSSDIKNEEKIFQL